MKYDRQRSPAEIEAEIARVRRSMDTTLTEIEGRLTTSQLVDQGIDYLRHSSAREFVSNLGTSVKHNPLSVTLVGIGHGSPAAKVGFFQAPYEASFLVPYWGYRQELFEVLQLAQQGRLTVHTEVFAVDDAPAAYAKLWDGSLRGRAVVRF